MNQLDFDNACAAFTMTMGAVANWKQTYMGAAYSTRLHSAIHDAEIAIARMKVVLEKDAAPARGHVAKIKAALADGQASTL